MHGYYIFHGAVVGVSLILFGKKCEWDFMFVCFVCVLVNACEEVQIHFSRLLLCVLYPSILWFRLNCNIAFWLPLRLSQLHAQHCLWMCKYGHNHNGINWTDINIFKICVQKKFCQHSLLTSHFNWKVVIVTDRAIVFLCQKGFSMSISRISFGIIETIRRRRMFILHTFSIQFSLWSTQFKQEALQFVSFYHAVCHLWLKQRNEHKYFEWNFGMNGKRM